MAPTKLSRSKRRNGKHPPVVEAPAPVIETPPVVPPDASQYVNRELSLLNFQQRVLEEAQDERNPLLERVKFLSIVGSNLAEFFMIRVAGLKQQVAAGVVELSPDGLTPQGQLSAIHDAALALMREARRTLPLLVQQLDKAGIHILDYALLSEAQRAAVNAYFDAVVFPVLTPLAFDPGRPFPHISNMSLNLAVIVRDPTGDERFARVKIPSTLPRLVPIAGSGSGTPEQSLVWLEQVIRANLPTLFPGMTILEAHPFRVTRDTDVLLQEADADDLLETVETSLRERQFGSVVRLTINPDMPAAIRDLLTENLELQADDIYTLDPPLGMSDLMGLYKLERPDLKDPPLMPVISPAFADPEIDPFEAIRRQDILLHHPYESFSSVVDFLQAAARDPQVLAIKQTLYRVGRNSPIVEALLEAARNGKQVAVLIELKARFDEESNIEWARALEQEGVHVVYGLLGLKTHSKIALVVRQEGERVRRYLHLATGNYNPSTSRLYTDLGMFTCDEAFGADATDVFNYLTGYSAKQDYRRFLVAPVNLRSGLEALIRREIDVQTQGGRGHLIFKLNSLVDKRMIQLLYEASQAGVQIDLLVRGICCLRPGMPGLSERIRVISIVGRFLEHSRIFWFGNGGKDEVYLGSADLMPRNLDRRVEIVFPVLDAQLVRYLRDNVLGLYLADTVKARAMQPDGTYRRVQPAPGQPPLNSQLALLGKSSTAAPPA